MARHWEMAVLPWGLLDAGILTGKFMGAVKDATRIDPEKVNLSDRALRVLQEVQKVAHEVGCSMSQVAINWIRQQGPKAQMIPSWGAQQETVKG